MECGNVEMCLRVCVLAFVVAGIVCNDEIRNVRLNPSCVTSYYRMFVTRVATPRNYKYFHESLLAESEEKAAEEEETNPIWRIVGGDMVTIQQAPYQVMYGLYCGGSLIAPNWVITAAHCKDKDSVVYVGSTYRSQALPYPICAHFFHPLWNSSFNAHSHDYDFQLLLLESPVPVTSSTRPISIGSMEDVLPGNRVSVSGWGYLKHKERRMQEILRRVYIPIVPQEICRTLGQGRYHNITDRMFCAGLLNGTKDACQGDSGGPAVSNGKLVGLVSFGIGCALPDLPGVYSLVPAVRDWIRTVTALPL